MLYAMSKKCLLFERKWIINIPRFDCKQYVRMITIIYLYNKFNVGFAVTDLAIVSMKGLTISSTRAIPRG